MFDIDFHKTIDGIATNEEEAALIAKNFLANEDNCRLLIAEFFRMRVKSSTDQLGLTFTQGLTCISSVGFSTFVTVDGFANDEEPDLPALTFALNVLSQRLLAQGGYARNQDN